MKYSFLYRLEEDIQAAVKKTGVEYPRVDGLSYETDKETLEEAIIDFLFQDFGIIEDIDPEVRVGEPEDNSYVGIEARKLGCYGEWSINGLSRFSELK